MLIASHHRASAALAVLAFVRAALPSPVVVDWRNRDGGDMAARAAARRRAAQTHPGKRRRGAVA